MNNSTNIKYMAIAKSDIIYWVDADESGFSSTVLENGVTANYNNFMVNKRFSGGTRIVIDISCS